MHFWKVNGAGNDFIILSALTLDLTEERFSALAKHLCHRRRSIGADGLMVVLPPEGKADFRNAAESSAKDPRRPAGMDAPGVSAAFGRYGHAGRPEPIFPFPVRLPVTFSESAP